MIKRFVVTIEASPNDFCESDLGEAIEDGLDNVGNYKFKKLNVTGFHKNENKN